MKIVTKSCTGLEHIEKEVAPTTDSARRTVSLTDLKPTLPRTVEDIRRTIQQKRFAELTPTQAGD